jgi:tRNA threonylcarbamoyladenosine biosynthesis protein TsaE
MKFITYKEEDNLKIAEDFILSVNPKDKAVVVGLYGNLGSGKTTFTKSVARVLGVSDEITSPTFVIEKIYELQNKKFLHFIHIDSYRLEREDELVSLGWNEIISDKNNLIFIEWPEKVSGIMPDHIKIKFSTLDDPNSREIDIHM